MGLKIGRRWQKLGMLLGLLALFAMFGGALLVGELLSRPVPRVLGAPPEGSRLQPVLLHTTTGDQVSGWYAPGTPGAGAVLLLHGVRSDRRQMVARAEALYQQGCTVLLVDLPAHGESQGERITFGWREAEGVRAAMTFLAETVPEEKRGVIGVSLGAASLVFASTREGAWPEPAAIVLESMYPTLEQALDNRLRLYLGPPGSWLAPLLLWQLPLRLGVSADEIRPLAHLSQLHVPVMVAAGVRDQHTTLAETRALFDAANTPKALWLVEGAAHVDLYRFNPQAYEARVFPFLFQYIRSVPQGAGG